MKRFKFSLIDPLKAAISEDVSQVLQALAIITAGLVILGSLAVFAFNTAQSMSVGW